MASTKDFWKLAWAAVSTFSTVRVSSAISARGAVQERDAGAGAGGVSGGADAVQRAVRDHAQDHGVPGIYEAAEGAGARLLMDKLEVDTPDRIVLAGAFGSHIDTKYAMVLGMIPDCPLESVSSAGNAAGTGARVALLNQAARSEIERVVRDIEKVETAVEPRFQEHFIEAVAFPHKSAPYPHLAAAVELSEPSEAPAEETPRRRRRRRG